MLVETLITWKSCKYSSTDVRELKAVYGLIKLMLMLMPKNHFSVISLVETI